MTLRGGRAGEALVAARLELLAAARRRHQKATRKAFNYEEARRRGGMELLPDSDEAYEVFRLERSRLISMRLLARRERLYLEALALVGR